MDRHHQETLLINALADGYLKYREIAQHTGLSIDQTKYLIKTTGLSPIIKEEKKRIHRDIIKTQAHSYSSIKQMAQDTGIPIHEIRTNIQPPSKTKPTRQSPDIEQRVLEAIETEQCQSITQIAEYTKLPYHRVHNTITYNNLMPQLKQNKWNLVINTLKEHYTAHTTTNELIAKTGYYRKLIKSALPHARQAWKQQQRELLATIMDIHAPPQSPQWIASTLYTSSRAGQLPFDTLYQRVQDIVNRHTLVQLAQKWGVSHQRVSKIIHTWGLYDQWKPSATNIIKNQTNNPSI